MITNDMISVPASTDAKLVTLTLAGDRDAFSQIVSRYQSLICSLAYSATGSLGQSEDLAQETFITAWKHLRHPREPGKLRAWPCGVARNRISNYLRREGRKPLLAAEPLENIHNLAAPEPLPVESAIAHEEQALLWRALERIPETYREPLVLFYREHQSVATVAAALDLSEDAVKQRLSRGRKLLQETMVAFVEGALERTRPGKAFTVAVLAALPVFAGSASAATIATAAAKGSSAAKAATSIGLAGAIIGPIAGLLGGVLGTKMSIENTRSPRERQFMVRFAWLTWMLVLLFCGLSAGFTSIARHRAKAHPLMVTTLFVSLGLGYSILLVTLVLWGNRKQRRIRNEEGVRLPVGTPIPVERLYTQPFEYRSRRTLLGLPLVHIRMECERDGKTVPAKGWIAIGNVAYGGLFAFAGFAVAPISLGGIAVGLVAMGGAAVGLLSFAGIALGFWAMGGAAVGYAAYGGGAVAWLAAQGGYAMAREFALGGTAFAHHANDEVARLFFQSSGLFAQVAKLMRHAIILVWLPVGLVSWQMLRVRRQR